MALFATKSEVIELKSARVEMKADLMRRMLVFRRGQIAALFAIVRHLK